MPTATAPTPDQMVSQCSACAQGVGAQRPDVHPRHLPALAALLPTPALQPDEAPSSDRQPAMHSLLVCCGKGNKAQSALIKRCLHDSLRDLLWGARAGHATAFIQAMRWAWQGSQLLSTSPDPCTGFAQAWGEQLTADEALGIS